MASDELRTVLSPLLSREGRAIWISANSCVCLNDDHSTVDDQHQKQFRMSLTDTDKHKHRLSIHASTLEEAIICLEYLVGLKDTHFEEMELVSKGDVDTRLCPFSADTLEKMLQNSARRISFNSMIFTPDHCRTLASSGTKTNIEFYDCEFQDKGAAFVEASAWRQDETSGPAKLRFFASYLPFNDRNLALFLSRHKLDSLELHYIDLNSEVSCRAVATAQVRCLTLEDCDLEDEGAALVELVRQGRGSKELCFHGMPPFGSIESSVTFINALRGNEHLERVHLPRIDDHQETRALSAALHENKGLIHLVVSFLHLDDSDRTELFKAISLHPSLRSLDLTMWQLMHSDFYLEKRREFTKAVADMLSVNERVEAVSFHDNTFDKDDWGAFVAPRLECNKYRKLFPSIQKIGEASTRAAVLARALAKFASKPHLVWMLLNHNRDIVSSYLDSVHDLNSIPSQKRSRSPSLDGMSAH
jgi:hypothetical protein